MAQCIRQVSCRILSNGFIYSLYMVSVYWKRKKDPGVTGMTLRQEAYGLIDANVAAANTLAYERREGERMAWKALCILYKTFQGDILFWGARWGARPQVQLSNLHSMRPLRVREQFESSNARFHRSMRTFSAWICFFYIGKRHGAGSVAVGIVERDFNVIIIEEYGIYKDLHKFLLTFSIWYF